MSMLVAMEAVTEDGPTHFSTAVDFSLLYLLIVLLLIFIVEKPKVVVVVVSVV